MVALSAPNPTNAIRLGLRGEHDFLAAFVWAAQKHGAEYPNEAACEHICQIGCNSVRQIGSRHSTG